MNSTGDWPHSDELRVALATDRLVICVGAGVSRAALPDLPDFAALLVDLLAAGVRSDYITPAEAHTIEQLFADERYLVAAEEIKYRVPADAYHQFIIERFDRDAPPSPIHLALVRLNLPLVLTTNFDHLLEDAYAFAFRRSPRVLTYKNATDISDFLDLEPALLASSTAPVTRSRTIFWKLHGTIEDPATIVLSERDHREVLHQPAYRDVLTEVFASRAVLFLGYTISDPSLTWILAEARRQMLSAEPQLYGTAADHAAAERLASTGLKVVPLLAEDSEVDQMVRLIESLAAVRTDGATP